MRPARSAAAPAVWPGPELSRSGRRRAYQPSARRVSAHGARRALPIARGCARAAGRDAPAWRAVGDGSAQIRFTFRQRPVPGDRNQFLVRRARAAGRPATTTRCTGFPSPRYCTLAVTDASPWMVNVQVFTLLPPLEHAPDQIASRVFVTLSVIDVPVLNVAEPVLPTATLIPAGLELTRSPLRPVAVTVSVAVWAGGAGGFTVSVAVLLTPPKLPPIVTGVAAVTPVVVTLKEALVAPAATVTLAGTLATVVLLLDSATTAPPAGAAEVKVTVPCDELPPTTKLGARLTADRLATGGGGGAACGVTRRAAENDPATPAALTARTRQKSCCAGRPPIVACDALTVWLVVSVLKLFEVEIWIRYVAPFATSLQSNRIGWATRARSAGLTRLGVPNVGGGAVALVTVKAADLLTPPRLPVMVTGVFAVTVEVVTVKPAEVAPAGTLTTGWGLATRLLVASVTDAPPAGAGPLRSTVPDTLLPPTTVGEASVTDERSGALGSGATLMKTDLVTPPAVASTCTDVPSETGLDVMVKLFALFPAGMDTVGGTWTTDGLLLVSVAAPPPGGASITTETVPRVEVPPIRPVGLAPKANSVGVPGCAGSISRSVA